MAGVRLSAATPTWTDGAVRNFAKCTITDTSSNAESNAFDAHDSVNGRFWRVRKDGLQETSDVQPLADSTYDIGTDSVRYRNIYCDSIHGNFAGATSTVTTTDATETTLATIATASDNVYHVTATVLGIETVDHDEAASYQLYGTFKNDGGTLTQVGNTTAPHIAEDTSTWDCDLDASGTDIRLRVTGAAATNINWEGHLSSHSLT